MKVLVTVGSKHGASDEIGAALRSALIEAGVDAVQLAPGDVASLETYDAVVLGSGVYAGRWVDAAKKFVDGHLDELRARPVWIFSSGPLGEPPKPDDAPPDGEAVAERIGAREHRVFAGSLDRAKLGFGERAIISLVKAPYGDFRSWETIGTWGAGIARALSAEPVA